MTAVLLWAAAVLGGVAVIFAGAAIINVAWSKIRAARRPPEDGTQK